MAKNNVQNIKFLRNGTVFVPSNDKTARQVAVDAMNEKLNSLADGTAILGRYKETDGVVKTLVGFAYISDDAKTLTVFDVDGAGADVDKKIKTAIEALDAEIPSSGGKNVQVKVTETDGKITAVNITTDNTVNSDDVNTAITNAINKLNGSVVAESGFYVKSVTEADGKIIGTTEALPTVDAISAAGKPITAVSENLGAISATAGAINAEFVNIADSGSIITATTVEGALAEIAAEIDGMDLDVVSGDGEVITAVSEKDGKVSASKTAIKDVKLTGYAKNTTATGAISATDDIEDALSKLENKIGSNAITNADGSITVTPADGSTTDVKVHIKSNERVIKLDSNSGGIYTNLNLVKITNDLPATVKESYELRDSDGFKIGESIDIPKDSHIVSITYDESTQKLVYTYINVEGETQKTEIDLSHLILETEVEKGIQSLNGKLSIKLDAAGDDTGDGKFLTVGADGLKLDGVTDAITAAIESLDATGGTQTIAGGNHVAVEVAEVNGKITTVTVVEDNIADADDLDAEITNRTNADTELSNRLGANVTTKNTASVQLSALSGTSEDASGVTSVNGAKKYAQQYADEKVAAVVDGLNATVSGETADGKVNVKVTEADGVITAVDVVGTDIASDSALTAEITARKAVDGQNGQTYAANSNANYISSATSLNDADIKLDIALKALDDDVIKSVKVNNVALGKRSNAVNVQISSTPASGTSASPIIVNTDDTTGKVTLQILQIDCGEY